MKTTSDDSYPSLVEKHFGRSPFIEIANFAQGGAAVRNLQTFNKWNIFLESKPDIVFLQIGSNDAKADYWQSESNFKQNYVSSIKKILAMPTKPKLVLMTNTPVLSCVETIRPDI